MLMSEPIPYRTINNIVGIYYIENLINHRKYVGQSKNVFTRWNDHRKQLRKNKHHSSVLQLDYNECGEENFEFKILQRCAETELDDLEIYYIEKYNSCLEGYNETFGGQHGSGETLKKKVVQLSLNGEFIREWDALNTAARELGVHQSVLWRGMINKKSAANSFWILKKDYGDFCLSNYRITKPNKIKTFQYSLKGELLRVWDSAADAAKELNIDASEIGRVCKKRFDSAYGYIWRYEYDSNISEDVLNRINGSPVMVFNRNGEIVGTYKTQTDASRSLGISPTRISRSKLDKKYTVEGYLVKRDDEICKELS